MKHTASGVTDPSRWKTPLASITRSKCCLVPLARIVEIPFTVVVEMVNRGNYHMIQAYLNHLRQVKQLNDRSVDRYRFYLRHLLLWADEASFSQIPEIRPTLPDFLTRQAPGDQADSLAPATLK